MRSARIIAATACVAALLAPLTSSAATKTVDIPGRYFSPQRVTITVGSAVRWTNSSSGRHSVTSMSSSADRFTSSDNCPGGILGFNDCLTPGATYQHTFSTAGTFDYYCKIHGNEGTYPNCAMCGRVTVKKKSGVIVPTTPGTAATATATSPSPSPTISGSALSSPAATTPAAAGPGDGTSSSTLLAIAALSVALLGGTGIVVYRTMIRSRT